MESVLLIEFLKLQEYYNVIFEGRSFEIIGKDDVGNLIGEDSEKVLFYLETEPVNIRYIANDLQVFLKQLEIYKKYEEIEEDYLEEYMQAFRESIKSLDAGAFKEESFWLLSINTLKSFCFAI